MIPLYRLAPLKEAEVLDDRGDEALVTISAEQQPLVLFARQVAEQADVSIVVEASLEEEPVTLEVSGQLVGDVIATVARRLGSQVTRTGDLYFIGSLRAEDRGVFVTRVGNLPAEELRQVAGLLLSENGRSYVSTSGTVVVADTVEVLSRVAEAVDSLRKSGRDVWMIQLHLIEVAARDADAVGLLSGASVGARLNTFGTSGFGAELSTQLEAIRESALSTVVAEPVYLVNDGEQVRYDRGQEFPIVETTTSELAQTQSVRYQSVGSIVEIGIRTLTADNAVMTVSIEDRRITDSSIAGFPIIDGFEYSSRVDVSSGGTYLLTTFERTETDDSWSRRLSWFDREQSTNIVSQVWCRVYRVEDATGSPFETGILVEDDLGLEGPADVAD